MRIPILNRPQFAAFGLRKSYTAHKTTTCPGRMLARGKRACGARILLSVSDRRGVRPRAQAGDHHEVGVKRAALYPEGGAGMGYSCSDGRKWVHAGLFFAALRLAEADDAGDEEAGG